MVSANRPSLTVSDTPVLNRMQMNQQVTSNLNWTEEIGQLMSRLPDQDPTTPEDYISIDAEVLTSAPLTDKEIVASVQRTGIDDSEDEEEETDETAFSPHQGDLRLSGPPSGLRACDDTRTSDRRVLSELRAVPLPTVPPKPSKS
ncbi:hypothetical protein PoB_004714100 [Plakobranchus ocellatus]|uniref:Uncharacterized protein n=1 Tax=Plakobranchus ocellatus TaxID=259542 RepID=A0AAV4BBC9_9GAST|nr:hypothetical protein PoB_004714100 [Plakobranchus ocellatus]